MDANARGEATGSDGSDRSPVEWHPAPDRPVRVSPALSGTSAGTESGASDVGSEPALTALLAAWDAMPEAAQLAQMLPTPALMTRIQALDLDDVDDATLVEVAAAARRVEAAAHEVLTRSAAVLAERTTMNQPALAVATKGEASTAGDELSIRLKTPRNECLSLIRQGILLTTTLVNTGTALSLGGIDAPRAKVMAEALWDVPWQTAMAVEDMVLPKAANRTPQQLRRDISKALIAVDPDDAHERAQRKARDRRVTRPRALSDGAASLWVEGPAADVLALDTALDAAARAAKAAGDGRTLDQLRFDTLADVGSAALATGEFAGTGTALATTVGGRRPEIHVTVALEHLLPPDVLPDGEPPPAEQPPPPVQRPTAVPPPSAEQSPAAAPPPSAEQSPAEDQRPPAEPALTPPARDIHADHPDPPTRSIDPESVPILAGYGPITLVTARAIAVGGILRRLVTDPLSGTVLDLGHTQYRPSKALADHIVARDRTCVGPGCLHTAGGCQLDHTVPWIDAPDGAAEPGDPAGGRTADDNLGPMCTRTHLIKTHGGFEVEQVEPGLFEWTTPAGLRYRRERDESVTFLGHLINGTLHTPFPDEPTF